MNVVRLFWDGMPGNGSERDGKSKTGKKGRLSKGVLLDWLLVWATRAQSQWRPSGKNVLPNCLPKP